MFVIVPDSLREAINAKLDVALATEPAAEAHDRECLYNQLLAFFDEHGYLPDFTVRKRP